MLALVPRCKKEERKEKRDEKSIKDPKNVPKKAVSRSVGNEKKKKRNKVRKKEDGTTRMNFLSGRDTNNANNKNYLQSGKSKI